MVRRLITAAAMACAAFVAVAEPIHLRCVVDDPKDNRQYETWVFVDSATSIMRTEGLTMPLTVTNDVYASMTAPMAGFRTVRSINRSTGKITITETSGTEIFWRHTGTCEKAEPPSRKF